MDLFSLLQIQGTITKKLQVVNVLIVACGASIRQKNILFPTYRTISNLR